MRQEATTQTTHRGILRGLLPASATTAMLQLPDRDGEGGRRGKQVAHETVFVARRRLL